MTALERWKKNQTLIKAERPKSIHQLRCERKKGHPTRVYREQEVMIRTDETEEWQHLPTVVMCGRCFLPLYSYGLHNKD